jgi:hypothetical protein
MEIMKLINKLMNKMKNAGSTDERFNHIDNIAILGGIMRDVMMFETSLITDLDVD